MYLKSLSLKGFKSFPDRTRLNFSPGVSVIVGPNGCGKSNITDAVLWALGEQSPSAIRGASMTDLIFAGGKGSSPRRFAEVEVVIDNSEGRANSEFSELSIKRRVERSGDSEYRLNDARCRLSDILDALADTNLGREMHSVISQGRVEQIVSSKPRERRLLIEESAGLGKHRKRRHRAQLKLERTRENLDRAIDVEREARSRMRPLKAQAEAAERGARLQREEDELRAELVAADLRGADASLAAAEKTVATGRERRDKIEERLAEVAKRRTAIEERIAAGDRARRDRGERLLEARSTLDRVGARRDGVRTAMLQLRAGLGERQLRLDELTEDDDEALAGRIAELESELAELDATMKGAAEVREAVDKRDGARAEADKAARLRGELAGELAAVEARLAAALGADGDDLLAGMIQAAPGIEHALSAALGERLRASVVGSIGEGTGRLDRAEGAARALVADHGAETSRGEPPTDDARPLLEMVETEEGARPVAERLLADTWLVDELASLPEGFRGIAVTVDGDCFDGSVGELRRLPRDATDPALLARSAREELALRLEQRQTTEQRARRELEIAEQELAKARAAADDAEASPEAVRRAKIEAELAAERRHAEAAARSRETRRRDREQLTARVELERELLPGLGKLEDALATLADRLRERVEELQFAGDEDGGEAPSEGIAAELRECSQQEFGIQTELREAGEAVTVAEVEAAQLRDRHTETVSTLEELAGRLERELTAAERDLTEEERERDRHQARPGGAAPRADRPGQPARRARVQRGPRTRRLALRAAKGPRERSARAPGVDPAHRQGDHRRLR